MAVQATFQQPHVLTAQAVGNVRQNQPGHSPDFLRCPIEVLVNIAEFIATGNNKVEAAKNAVNFGKVCAYTHIVTHEESLDKVIEVGAKSLKQWVEDPNTPWRFNLVDHTGKVITTTRFSPHV